MATLTEVLLSVSALSMLFGAIGIFRMRSFMMRMQAATMISVGGVMGSLLIFLLTSPNTELRLKSAFLLFLLFLTVPVSSHLIALCYYHSEEEKKSRMGG